MQSNTIGMYKNKRSKRFSFDTYGNLATFIPRISLWSLRRNVVGVSCRWFLCVGLLVDYLLIRLLVVSAWGYETIFNKKYFIINHEIIALCSYNLSAVVTYIYTYIHTQVAVHWKMKVDTHTYTHSYPRLIACTTRSHLRSGEVGCTIYSFICLSAGVVEWHSHCFVILLLHHAPPTVTSVLVLFVIFGGLFLVLIYK